MVQVDGEARQREERRETPHDVRLLGMRAEEDLLQIRESRAETADEEDADEQAPEAGDQADDDVDGSKTLRPDES